MGEPARSTIKRLLPFSQGYLAGTTEGYGDPSAVTVSIGSRPVSPKLPVETAPLCLVTC